MEFVCRLAMSPRPLIAEAMCGRGACVFGRLSDVQRTRCVLIVISGRGVRVFLMLAVVAVALTSVGLSVAVDGADVVF